MWGVKYKSCLVNKTNINKTMKTFKELSNQAPDGFEFTLKVIPKEGLKHLDWYWRYNRKVIDAKQEMITFKPVNKSHYESSRTYKNEYIHEMNKHLAYLIRHNYIRKIDINANNKINISILDTILHKNIFVYRDTKYRLTGYLFIYELSDGSKEFVCCDITIANGISGYGVAGVVAYINEIEFIEEITNWTNTDLRDKKNRFDARVNDDNYKYNFLRGLAPGLSRIEYDNLYIEHILSQLDNSHFL